MLKIAITGGIACGKSEVGKIIESMNISVLDTDLVCNNLLQTDFNIIEQITSHFGVDNIVTSMGSINKIKLAQIVFSNPKELQFLNNLIHPRCYEIVNEWINCHDSRIKFAEFRKKELVKHIVVVQIPLLFETKQEKNWDKIICISTNKDEQSKRIIKKFGVDGLKRLNSQIPIEEKKKLSHYVIENNGTLDQLKEQVNKIFEPLK
jgi:dephospho-CoA kinase